MVTISFEGGEGSGKGTVCKQIETFLKDKGYNVLSLREPGSTKCGEDIRSIIFKPEYEDIDPVTEALLFAASRCELVTKKVKPAIKAGKYDFILFDRFIYSSFVYNGLCNGLFDFVEKINDQFLNGWRPDICFLLDIDPETARKRIENRKEGNNRIDYKPIEYHKKIREYYLSLADKFSDITVIDASKNSFKECLDVIKRKGWLK